MQPHQTSESMLVSISPSPQESDAMSKTEYRLRSRKAEPQVDARPLTVLLDEYLRATYQRGVSKRAIAGYHYQTRPFVTWWEGYAPTAGHTFTPSAAQDFTHWLRTEYRTRFGLPARQNTLRTVCRRVRDYLHWLYKAHYVSIDMAPWIALPSSELTQVRALSGAELVRVFNATKGNNRVRDLALLAFLTETGCRAIEAAHVRWEGLTFTGTTGVAHLEVVKGHMDQDKKRTVVFGEATVRLLQLLAVYTGIAQGKVFSLTPRGIGFVMDRLSDRSGVEFGAHDLRKTFATYWVLHYQGSGNNDALGMTLLEMQLGHKPRTVTTRHYVSLDWRDVQAHYVSPLANLDLVGLGKRR